MAPGCRRGRRRMGGRWVGGGGGGEGGRRESSSYGSPVFSFFFQLVFFPCPPSQPTDLDQVQDATKQEHVPDLVAFLGYWLVYSRLRLAVPPSASRAQRRALDPVIPCKNDL